LYCPEDKIHFLNIKVAGVPVAGYQLPVKGLAELSFGFQVSGFRFRFRFQDSLQNAGFRFSVVFACSL
jgi:hypothetical protein